VKKTPKRVPGDVLSVAVSAFLGEMEVRIMLMHFGMRNMIKRRNDK